MYDKSPDCSGLRALRLFHSCEIGENVDDLVDADGAGNRHVVVLHAAPFRARVFAVIRRARLVVLAEIFDRALLVEVVAFHDPFDALLDGRVHEYAYIRYLAFGKDVRGAPAYYNAVATCGEAADPLLYDEIACGMLVKKYQYEKRELLESLAMKM